MTMQRRALAYLGVVAALMAGAGCASSAHLPESPPAPTVTTSASPSDLASLAASNKKHADDEARRLLALAQIPRNATELTAPPPSEQMPALGKPMTSSLIDHARYWRVQMPFDDAVAWAKAHPPSGLTANGSSTGSGGGVRRAGFAYGEPGTQAWGQAQLEIEVASGGTAGSDIRADGMTVWRDPRPSRDTSTGNRLTVTVADGCPRSDKGYSSVANEGAELDNALLPPGKPTGGLVCVYYGMNGKPFSLADQQVLTAQSAGDLVSVIRAIPLTHLDDAVTNCPMDDGAAAVIVFSYPNRPDVALWSKSNGCRFIRNGHIAARPDDAFDRIVMRLTRPSQPLM